MKDNLSLVAAAAGGFMLSVALAGILRGAPVTSWQVQANVGSTPVMYVRATPNTNEIIQKNSHHR
ncbi:hypothetical protein [Fischerella sp. PCC 9605]|uniref:hypothetical protein n=1 Tax=Fischerella sp. PCC 9605 TaxID=1173024 RepID=UPI00047EC76E|nr:hypothetical protein [Fischerella sp. PCC 9605]